MKRQQRIAVDGISPEQPLRVLYIVGCGRSGSTVLDTILGNHGQIESVGEATHIPEQAWLDGGFCACGKSGGDCPFWTEVRRHWTDRVGPIDLEDYLDKAREIEPRLRLSATHDPLVARDPWHSDYARLTAGLLAAVRDASGAQVVVDSSKSASRALALSMVDGVDLRLIHMVRDCRGMAWSGKKRFAKDERAGVSKNDHGRSVARSAMIWNVVNLVSGRLRRYLPRRNSIRLRYEDFVARPDVELRRIGDLVGIDLGPLAAAVAAGEPMAVGHTIAGNRLRMAGEVRLRADTEWTEKLTGRERAVCWALSGWLMAAYGYRRQPSMAGPSPCFRSAECVEAKAG